MLIKRSNHTLGMTLIELMIAVVVLAIGSLGLAAAYLSAATLDTLTWQSTDVQNASQSAFAEVRDLIRDTNGYTYDQVTYTGLDAAVMRYIYDTSSRNFTAEEVVGSDGNAATGVITFYLNEAQVPLDCGATTQTGYVGEVQVGSFDLDGDVAVNNYSNADSSEDLEELKIMPVSIEMTWQAKTGSITKRRFYLIPRILTSEQAELLATGGGAL